jgi:3-hydroxyisobutyrate dehydrogenase-like beta-hydroxyacid dehydrogenase
MNSIGVIGYGDVGEVIAEASARRGYAVTVTNRSTAKLQDGRVPSDLTVVETPAGVVQRSDLTISCVWPATAADVATRAANGFVDGDTQWYYDLNSISPKTTGDIARTVAGQGGTFLKGTIMGSVSKFGTDVRLTLAGQHREPVRSYLSALGFTVREFGDDIEKAAARKMIRSVFTKGIRALLAEALLAAEAYDLSEETLTDLATVMSRKPFDAMARDLIENTPENAHRRYGESLEMEETIRDLGYRYPVTQATTDLHRIIHENDVSGESYRQIIRTLEEYYKS